MRSREEERMLQRTQCVQCGDHFLAQYEIVGGLLCEKCKLRDLAKPNSEPLKDRYAKETGDKSDCFTYLNNQGEFVISESYYDWLEKKADIDYALLADVRSVIDGLYGKNTDDMYSQALDDVKEKLSEHFS